MAKVLIIDDDPDFNYVMQTVLESHDFEVETATTPEEGIDKVLNTGPDLVVLDIMMPTGYEGFDVAREIREKHNLTDLPIVVLTAVHDAKKEPYRFAPDKDYLPVDVFLDKPVEPNALVDIIKELLGERREEPEHPL